MKNKNSISILFLILLTFILQFWVLNKNNFFIFDDFSHFANSLKQIKFSFIPKQVYNDRPVGQLVINFLFSNFKFNNQLHHLFLLILHIINAILLFFLTKKIIFKRTIFPFLTALFFANWPRSIFAISWDAAIFDTVSTLLALIFLNLYFYFKSTFSKILYVFIFCLMIRTKESMAFIPVIPLAYDFLIKKIKKIKIESIITITLGIGYVVYLYILGKNGGFQNFGKTNPYFTSMNPIIMTRNIYRYLYLYTNLNLSGFSFQNYSTINILISSLFIIVTSFFIKNKKILFLIISFLVSIFPVLPMVNTQHKLYLYFPSIFLASISILVLKLVFDKFIKNNFRIISCCILLLLIYANYLNTFTLNEKRWWLEKGKINRNSYEYLEKIPKPKKNSKFIIYNINEDNNIFLYGPGHIMNAFYSDNSITTTLNKNEVENKKGYCLINYNSSSLILDGCY